MTKAQELLDEATPLPWTPGDEWILARSGDDPSADRALILYAVNRLPDYEAAVEALDRLIKFIGAQSNEWQPVNDARAALARLRDE